MDLIYVSYNSQKWIEGCFDSILNSDFDLKKINIWIIDNHSSDHTVELLYKAKTKLEKKVSQINIVCLQENLGFGKANNIGSAKGNDDIICFFNIDTQLLPDTLKTLENEILQSDPQVALWELRQLPYEHPKYYNPVTKETTWSSGAAFAVRRKVFELIDGFDASIFMYAEDVDLSWRVRKEGYLLNYIPKASIIHYSFEQIGKTKPNQYIYSIINNLYLRYKYGTIKEILWGHLLFWNCIRGKEKFEGARKWLLKEYGSLLKNTSYSKKINFKKPDFNATFLNFDYEIVRDGEAYYYLPEDGKVPLVSIIVRTCGRPEVLRETLISLRNQTYTNTEIVIAEDGPEISKEMIMQEFRDLKIHYFSTGSKVGRSKAGNLAMQMAKGKYINFLDDDDLFFADHIETLVNVLNKHDKKAAYSTAFETPIEVFSQTPYCYKVHDYIKRHKQPFDKIILCHHNYIPIQCIMFEKTLFDDYGGLDESLDALEDWDLWVRYSLNTEFEFVEKTTSIYRIPYNKAVNSERQKKLDEALKVVRNKHKQYLQTLSVYEIAMLYEHKSR